MPAAGGCPRLTGSILPLKPSKTGFDLLTRDQNPVYRRSDRLIAEFSGRKMD
jgi:hypothetical protein